MKIFNLYVIHNFLSFSSCTMVIFFFKEQIMLLKTNTLGQNHAWNRHENGPKEVVVLKAWWYWLVTCLNELELGLE